MSYESGLIGYAAFASLAMSMKKHSSLGWSALPPPPILRLLGWTLLALSAAMAVAASGAALGVTAWIGQMCAAAAALVLLLSWRPRVALALAGACLVAAAGLSLL